MHIQLVAVVIVITTIRNTTDAIIIITTVIVIEVILIVVRVTDIADNKSITHINNYEVLNKQKERYHCGSWWLPKWVRKILSVKFNASCYIHDLDYKRTRTEKEEADTRFLLNMIKQSKGSIFLEIIATIFYIIVRILGIFSWGRKTKNYE